MEKEKEEQNNFNINLETEEIIDIDIDNLDVDIKKENYKIKEEKNEDKKGEKKEEKKEEKIIDKKDDKKEKDSKLIQNLQNKNQQKEKEKETKIEDKEKEKDKQLTNKKEKENPQNQNQDKDKDNNNQKIEKDIIKEEKKKDNPINKNQNQNQNQDKEKEKVQNKTQTQTQTQKNQNKKNDNISIPEFQKQKTIDTSKYKIFIDFKLNPEKNEIHLNEILGESFDLRVREKNIRFLLRRKSIIKNEFFTSFILREYNLMDKIKKIPIDYSKKIEEILNKYLNENDYDNLFKKAIGDDNNNKQNLIKLLEKDKINDKAFYLFDNISALYSLDAFGKRFNIIDDEKFDKNFQANKVLKDFFNEDEIVKYIYAKKDKKKDNEYNDKDNDKENEEENKNIFHKKSANLEKEKSEENNSNNNKNNNNNNNNSNNNISMSNKHISSSLDTSFNLTSLKKEIYCWRESVSDGDSFYRMFMFGIMEYYILSKNLHEIKKILFDINRVYETSVYGNPKKSSNSHIFNSKEIDYGKVVIIFNLIIEALKNNQIEKAYDTLINSYNLEDKSFDYILIGYLRTLLYKGIGEILMSSEYSSLENKIKSKFIYIDIYFIYIYYILYNFIIHYTI
jgi:hypothetical protein